MEKKGLGDEGADRGNAPRIFGLEPPLRSTRNRSNQSIALSALTTKVITREHWIQRITFATERLMRRAVDT